VRITRIEPQQRKPGRRNIYADGEFLVGLSVETVLRHGLRTGDELSPEAVRTIVASEEFAGAKKAAMRLLAVRPRTEREIRDRLRLKEFPDTVIARVVDELRQSRLLDDEEFARMFVRDALVLRPAGRIPLRRKLLLLGVAKELVDRVLDETFAGVDQADAALGLAHAYIKKCPKGLEPVTLRSRLGSYLARRGYPWDIVQQVLRKTAGDDE